MAAEAGFEIDGTVYAVPTLDTLNMDEAQVLYDYSGLAVEDFLSPPPDSSDVEKEEQQADRAQKLKNPGVLRALMHIAYQRGNTDLRPAKIKALVSGQNVLEALLAFAGAVEDDDAVPPALTTEPEQQSQNDSVVSSTSSGLRSANDSVPPDDLPEPTGPTKSDTSAMSDRTLSAA